MFDYRLLCDKTVVHSELLAAATPESAAFGEPSAVDLPEQRRREARAVEKAKQYVASPPWSVGRVSAVGGGNNHNHTQPFGKTKQHYTHA